MVYCIRNNIMKEFLELHGSEVSNMLLSEWNMDEALEVAKEEGMEEAFADGFAGGVEYGLAAEREKNIRAFGEILPPDKIASTLEVPIDYVLKVLEHEAACTMQVREPDMEYVAEKKQ